MNDEATVQNLKNTVRSLETDIAVHESDINRSLEELKNKFNVNDLEDALNKADELNKELGPLSSEKTKIINEIKIVMEKYQGE